MFLHFDEQSSKKLQKAAHAVKKHEKSSIWPKLATLSSKLPCFCISMNFSGRSCKKCLISWKRTKTRRFGQNLQLFEETTLFWHLDDYCRKKLQKVVRFVKKHEKSSIWSKLCNFSNNLPCFCISMKFSARSWKEWLISWKSTKNHRFGQQYATFRTNYHVFAFGWTFQEEVAKSASFREKGRKLVDLAKTCNFSKKLPCFGISMIIAGKSCKKWFVSWKSTKNHRFGQNFATFRTIYHVFAFRWSFQQEVAKSGSFREKARKIIDLANNMQLFEQTTMFLHLDELLRKRLEKVLHFVKKHEKSSIWSKLASFRKNYQVLTFRWSFQQEVAKSASFREKARKIIDLAKTLQLFEQSTMFLHLDELLRKRLEKVPHFVKKHEKSSIWPKLCNFSNKLPCFCIWMNSLAEKCKKCLISQKSTKNSRCDQNCATFRANYHVLAFRWSF